MGSVSIEIRKKQLEQVEAILATREAELEKAGKDKAKDTVYRAAAPRRRCSRRPGA